MAPKKQQKAPTSKRKAPAAKPAPVRKKPKTGPRTIRAEISAEAYEGYALRWHNSTPIHEHEPYIDEISAYNEEDDEDIEIVLEDTDIEFQIHENPDDPEEFTISFEGTIEFTVTPEELEVLESRGWSVDYCMGFKTPDGNFAEAEADFTFMENMNVRLEPLPD
jgi:hypothetical protein